ncbi:MAG: putative HicB family RNase H-like nuclease [Desulforhopalus sp.]|jgi:predicted HicB family RNase H-like nuclease
MAQKTIAHKGYHGTIKVNTNDYSLFGTILFIDEEINYSGQTFSELEAAFQIEVDAHIKACVEKGVDPPFSD